MQRCAVRLGEHEAEVDPRADRRSVRCGRTMRSASQASRRVQVAVQPPSTARIAGDVAHELVHAAFAGGVGRQGGHADLTGDRRGHGDRPGEVLADPVPGGGLAGKPEVAPGVSRRSALTLLPGLVSTQPGRNVSSPPAHWCTRCGPARSARTSATAARDLAGHRVEPADRAHRVRPNVREGRCALKPFHHRTSVRKRSGLKQLDEAVPERGEGHPERVALTAPTQVPTRSRLPG